MRKSHLLCFATARAAALVLFVWAGIANGNDLPKWTPGESYPVEGLTQFACHDYTLPCGKMGSPEVEEVEYSGPTKGDPERGAKIATNARWGNCIACHSLPQGHAGGEIGPDLADYSLRNAPFKYTFQRIWDARYFNPNAHMPVYGPMGVLSAADIVDVIAFLESGK